MSSTLLLALAATVQAAGIPPLPDQRGLYQVLFEDIHSSIANNHSETGISLRWTQGYDVRIDTLECTQDGRAARCRFGLIRTPDGTPTALHAGTSTNAMNCRAELRYARGPNGAPEAWRVRTWPPRGGLIPRSSMRCDLDRSRG